MKTPSIARILQLATAIALLAAFAASPAQAQLAPYIGYNTQNENAVYGSSFQVPVSNRVKLAPSLEAGLGSNTNYVQANADVTADLTGESRFIPYVGLGVAASSIPVNGETKARMGGNALAGVRIGGLGAFNPFAQARYTNVRGGDAMMFNAGASLRF